MTRSMGIPKTIERDGTSCHHCFKIVARNRALHTGKGRVRHKCPHGNDCGAGTRRGVMSNNASNCNACYWEFGRVWLALRQLGTFDANSRPTWTGIHAAVAGLGLHVPDGKAEAIETIKAIEGMKR